MITDHGLRLLFSEKFVVEDEAFFGDGLPAELVPGKFLSVSGYFFAEMIVAVEYLIGPGEIFLIGSVYNEAVDLVFQVFPDACSMTYYKRCSAGHGFSAGHAERLKF